MTGCLYEVLGLTKEATQDEIKKAYRQRALQLHPDKNPGNEDANAKFQLLQKVYAVLGDAEKRKIYDETGIADDDDLAGAHFDGLVDYFRAMYGIKTEDIDGFTERYQGSDDERADLLRYYKQFKGRMESVFLHLMCSDPDLDSHRLRDVLEEAIEAGELERYKAYTSWAKSVAARPRPPARRKSAGGPSNALIAAIQSKRAAAADSFFDSLAAKYGGPSGKDKGKGKEKTKVAKAPQTALQANAEPTDSEFEAARRRLQDCSAFKGSATSKDHGKSSKSKAGGASAKKNKKGSRVRDDEDEDEIKSDSDADMEDVIEEDIVEEEEEEEQEGAKRPAKKARRSDAAGSRRTSTGGAVENTKSAKKQKRKSGCDQAQVAQEVGDEGAKEENEGEEGGKERSTGGKRPLKAKAAAAQEAVATEQGVGAKGGKKAQDKKGKAGEGEDARRGAEKENKGCTPTAAGTGGQSKGKEKRQSGAAGEAAPGRGEGPLSSKKGKAKAAP